MDALISEKTLRGEIIGVSRVTWWSWQKQGKLLPPCIKIGKSRYYRRDSVEACQSALKIDPPSASKIDPPQRLVFV